jgi:hypothetical protein
MVNNDFATDFHYVPTFCTSSNAIGTDQREGIAD